MKTRIAAILITLLTASLACSFGGSQATDTPAENTVESDVLFQDDFTDTSSGWDRVNTQSGLTDYADGVYRIFVNEASTDVWANPGLTFTDVAVDVEATKVGGPDDNDFGVTCRSVDTNNFYFFIISSDGYYGIGKVVDGAQQLIGMDAMEPSDAVKQGEASNRLHVECAGTTLSLWVNGQMIKEVEDTQFAKGDVGLMAGSFDVAGTDIHFDNFSVKKPE